MPLQICSVPIIIEIKVVLEEVLPIAVHGVRRPGKRPDVSIFEFDLPCLLEEILSTPVFRGGN